MSLTPPAFLVAKICFALAAVILVVRTVTWLRVARVPRWEQRLAVLMLCVAVGGTIGSWRWVDARAKAWQRDVHAEAQKIAEAVVKGIKPDFAGGVVLRTMGNTAFEDIPQLHRKGIKVQMHLSNNTYPATELENVTGQVWTESKYLIATFRSSPSDHPWIADGARLQYLLRYPVFSKMSGEWLPTLVFDLPPPGQKIMFGAQIVSKTTDYTQYIWGLVNENGKPVISGGDATPDLSKLFKPK
jgi:hypothetical protein